MNVKSKGNWSIQEYGPQTVTPQFWERYHAYRRARWEERGDPDEPYPPNDLYVSGWLEDAAEEDWESYHAVIEADGQIVSAFSGGAPKPGTANYATNGHILWAGGGVLEPWRRQGIGETWLRYARQLLPRTGATTLTINTHEPDGHAFLERIAGEPKQRLRYSRVDYRTLDWGMIDRWVAEQGERAPGTTLELFEKRLPEALWPEYCAAKMEQMRHIPRDGLDMGDWIFEPKDQAEMYKWMDSQSGEHHVIWVRDPAGKIVAITDIGWFPFQANGVQQFFTGVHPDARGLGLGKLVKARMLQHVRDTYGQHDLKWVRTDNATSNAAMLAINERLGFREHKVAGIYQIKQDKLDAFLNDRS